MYRLTVKLYKKYLDPTPHPHFFFFLLDQFKLKKNSMDSCPLDLPDHKLFIHDLSPLTLHNPNHIHKSRSESSFTSMAFYDFKTWNMRMCSRVWRSSAWKGKRVSKGVYEFEIKRIRLMILQVWGNLVKKTKSLSRNFAFNFQNFIICRRKTSLKGVFRQKFQK